MKNQKSISLIILTVITLPLVFNSCTKEEIYLPEKNNCAKLENQVLSFNTEADFINTIERLKNEEKVLFPDGFMSLSSSCEIILKASNEDLDEDTLIYSKIFRNMVNTDYEIIVSDVLYKITPYGTMFTKIKYKNELRELAADDGILSMIVETSEPIFINKKIDGGFYSFKNNENVYLYDTYSLYNKALHSSDNNIGGNALSLKIFFV